MKKGLLLSLSLFLLILIEILKVYFIMPFPGSQKNDTIGIAYFINNNIWWMRIALAAIIMLPLIHFLLKGKGWQKIVLISALLLYGLIVYAFNFKFLADKMFYQPKIKSFMPVATDTTDINKLIIGVALGSESKAYPLEIIGYHHQIKDTIGGEPIMVTYCTVCRTGRVYSPFVHGKYEQFRLVGMNHFNAMFEDASTKSWWQQENGTAITGSLKGTALKEFPSAQMRWKEWETLHPNTLILQPDKNFKAAYDSLKGYDEGTIKSSLEARDTASWKMKSWVVGVLISKQAKAYDWNALLNKHVIEDSFASTPLLLAIDSTSRSFFVMNRKIETQTLHFNYNTAAKNLTDNETHSLWTISGLCIDGLLKGSQLQSVSAYQEFWHSWQNFHKETEMYKP